MTGKPRVTKIGPHTGTTIRNTDGERVSVGPAPVSRGKVTGPRPFCVWLHLSLDRDEDGYDGGCEHGIGLTTDEAIALRDAITAALAVRWEAPL